MKRPLVFAFELVAAMALATGGAYIANRFSHKQNREAQALERIAAAAEKVSDAPQFMECRDNRGNLTPCPHDLPRPSLLPARPDVCSGKTLESCADKAASEADDKNFERTLDRADQELWERTQEARRP